MAARISTCTIDTSGKEWFHGPRFYDAALKTARTVALFAALFSLAASAANFAVPALMQAGRSETGIFLWTILAPLCHQKSERSLFLFGWQMGMCARCTAMFMAALVPGLVLFIRPGLVLRRIVIYPAALGLMAPMMAEILFSIVFQSDFDIKVRMITGALYGAGAALFMIVLAQDLKNLLAKRLQTITNRRRT
jgi:uncharacterized membrane protein